jgi:DNA processing protein
MWNIDSRLVESLITPLLIPGGETNSGRVFAAAAWSYLIEPGDRIAGSLIKELGVEVALSKIIERPPASKLVVDSVSTAEMAEAQARWEPRLDSAAFERCLRSAASTKTKLVIPTDAVWPNGLNDLEVFGPKVLWIRGDVDKLPSKNSAVSIIGARASTGYGEHVAMDLAAGLCSAGYTIVSGGAYGIDGMAHRAALACEGKTVAVLAGGIDRLYPAGHEELLKRIMENGAVVSEVAPGSAPTRWRFLQRNRLIAAIASVTVVVEAGQRSGSLNTAGHALELERPIGVFPGPVTSGSSAGCHRLLRENPATTLVTGVRDVLEILTGEFVGSNFTATASPEHTRVLDALQTRRGKQVSEISATSGMSTSQAMAILGELELTGKAKCGEDGWLLAGSR